MSIIKFKAKQTTRVVATNWTNSCACVYACTNKYKFCASHG